MSSHPGHPSCRVPSTVADLSSYRAHPDWVGLILIRKVTDIAAVGIEAKNEDERFEKAFKDVPRQKWHVFENAGEVKQIISQAIVDDA